MPFEKGQSGNPNGRPKGSSGRTRALALLDKIFGTETNLDILENALQTLFISDPVKFFRDFAIDLTPKGYSSTSAGGVDKTPAETCEDMDKATIGDKPDDVASTEISP